MSGTARICNLLRLAGCADRSFLGEEVCSVGQYAVQNYGKLAGERDLRLAHAGAGSQTHPPALQRRALDWSGQDDIGRLVEGSADAAVSDLGNAAGDVGLARLILFGGQPEMRSDGFGGPEPAGIVDCRGIVSATMVTPPGAVISRRTRPSSRARDRRRFSSFCHCSKSVLRAASSASTSVDSVVWPATSSRIRPGKVRGVVGPTFSPKPRSTPRRLISTSWFLVRSSLRAVSSARTSCAGSDLQCTGRNQPSRISWAMPRASFPIG